MSKIATAIRPFEAGDYKDVTAINNALWPEFPTTAEEIAHRDQKRDEDMKDPDKPIQWKRFVWAEDGRVLASAAYEQSPWIYHPRKFEFWIMVHPEAFRRGIGSALYEHLMAELEPFDPVKLSTWTCPEKTPQTPAFLEARGWKPGMKVWDSKLDLETWDPEPFAAALTRAEEQGIRLVSLAELRDSDPDWQRKTYEMEREIWKDIPLPDKQTDPGFEWYKRHLFESPNLYPEAWFMTLDGERPVGLSCLWKQKSGNHLANGLTGTLREYRKRGLAMAMKVKVLSFAKAQGHPWVMTDNEENNVGMIGINKRLGFVDYPSWMGYELHLAEEES